ncbi:MAG: universal stress protein [Burkholderiaceae bacterium]|nr:universal stress protein [Burkholderiaceae bacterium]
MKILMPIDGTELSLHEVRFAVKLVQQGLKADFLLVNVQEPANLYEMVTAHDPEVIEKVSQEAGEHALQPAVKLLQAAGVDCETVVITRGDAVDAMIEMVEENGCELVITGSRGAGLIRSALGGSVSQSLVHDSPVPVLLVKPPENDEVTNAEQN